MTGWRSILEDLAILSILVSAICYMDVKSMADYLLILMFMFRRTKGTMKIIMIIQTGLYILRMVVILSNMYESMSPMVYPKSISLS